MDLIPETITITLSLKNVEYSVSVEPSNIPVRGNAMASGDPSLDKGCEDRILRDLENGNVFAWCDVTVTARLGPFEALDHIAAMSAGDESELQDLIDGHEMHKNALISLVEKIKREEHKDE